MQEIIWGPSYRYQKAKHSWLMQHCGLHQTDLIEATFLRARLEFQSSTHSHMHTSSPTGKGDGRLSVDQNDVSTLGFLIAIQSDIRSLSRLCLRTFLQLNVWLWFTVFTQRLSPQSGFGHPATTVHENARSRHQRLFQDYSSQQHEITLWQIQLAWQDTMSLIRSHSVLNQIAYKCPKLNQAAPWNVASWLYWSLTQTGRHLAPRTDSVFSKAGAFCISFTRYSVCEV